MSDKLAERGRSVSETKDRRRGHRGRIVQRRYEWRGQVNLAVVANGLHAMVYLIYDSPKFACVVMSKDGVKIIECSQHDTEDAAIERAEELLDAGANP